MLIGILQQLSINQTEGSLDDSEDHLSILIFILEQLHDIYHVIQNGAHLLPIGCCLKQSLSTLSLCLVYDLDKCYHFCENAHDRCANAYIKVDSTLQFDNV